MASILIIDDEVAIATAFAMFFRHDGAHQVTEAHTGQEGIDAYRRLRPDLVLLDVRLPDMTGFDVLDAIREDHPVVIMVTAYGDVPLAVATLKKGAFDFFEKPFNDNELVTRVLEAMALDAGQRAANATVDSVNSRLSTLTSRERQVMELVLLGKFNKVIADELNISMRTVEVHRANLFDKMKVKTAVELANLLKLQR